MLYLITGVPGSGKSLLAVEWQRQWIEEGRPVYSDVDGVDMAKVASNDIAGESPRDWRTTPEGSVVVYDEAQGKFPSTGKPGRPDDPVLLALETHRHSGHDLVFICQNATMIHHHIRKLVGRHAHVQRAFGANAANIFQWYEATDERDRGERAKADKQLWRYPKKLFKAYQSATVHTHKLRIPRKLAFISIVIVGVAAAAAYAWSRVDFGAASEMADAPASGGSSGESSGSVGQGSAVRSSSAGGDSGGEVRSVSESQSRGTAHLGGSLDGETMDGADLNHHWRLVGVVDSLESGKGQYLIRGDGRTVSVPNESMGWKVHSYDEGVLHVSAPGGPLLITWHTGPRKPKESSQTDTAAMAPKEPAKEGSEKMADARKAIPEESEWSTGSVTEWDDGS